MIRFAHSEYLFALVLIPILLIFFGWALQLRKRLLMRFGNISLLKTLMPSVSRHKTKVKYLLLILAFAFIVLGASNPQVGTKLEEVKREGVDIFIALDVSNSMKAEDIKPNRLESAKQEISRMLDKFQNDRLGLIIFAGESYLQLPLTTDYSAARLVLSAIDVDAVPIPGTAIGSAIKLAMKSFTSGERKYKVIIVISDGENHEDDAIAAAKDANAEGVIVHTVGMGTPEGVPIPIYENNVLVGYKKDQNENTVLTKLDERGMIQIAEAGGGVYIRATTGQDEMDEIFKHIQAMEKKELGAKVFTDYEDRFQYFIAVAILLLTLEFFISERRNIWLSKLSFFKEE